MQHIDPERLQRFLAGDGDQPEREALESHLAHCSQCSDSLVRLAADDQSLSEALVLSEAEAAWIQNQDLTEPVLHRIAPRVAIRPQVLIAGLMMLPGFWIGGLIIAASANWLVAQHPVGLVITISRLGLPLLFRFMVWMAQGGLLTRLWPLFILGPVLWFWRLNHAKETNRYA